MIDSFGVWALNKPFTRQSEKMSISFFIKSKICYIKTNKISKQTQCDDNEFRTMFKREAFVVNLASAKYYLLQLINKSLFHYYDTDDDLSVVMRNVKLASIYHTKANYNLAEIHLKKAEKIADKKELFLYAIGDILFKAS